MQALLPPIVQVSALASREDARLHQKRLQAALLHLEKGLLHLTHYNVLFRSVVRRIRAKDAVSYVNTRSQEGILRNRVAIVKLRLARLGRIVREWNAQAQRRAAHTARHKQQRQTLRHIRKMQLSLRKVIRKQAVVFQRSDVMYKRMIKDIRQRRRGASVLTWLGVGTLAVGVLGGVGGVVAHVESEAWAIPNERKTLSPVDARLAKDLGTGLLIGGGVLVGIGAALWVTGRLFLPPRDAFERGIVRAHSIHLKWEQKQTNK
jgi:hypothetical protein